MTLCPIAIAVGCKKCPAFGFCPLKSAIGDYNPEPAAPPKSPPAKASPARVKSAPHRSKRSTRRAR